MTKMLTRSTPAQPAAEAASQTTSPAILDSRTLFRGGNTVQITHAGQCYQLRLTRENKLILTK